MSDEPILELSGLLPERPKRLLRWPENPDGTLVELVQPEELDELSLREIGRDVAEYLQLSDVSEGQNLEPAQAERLKMLSAGLTERLIVGAPEGALDSLPAVTRRAVILGFFARAGDQVTAMLDPKIVSRLASSAPGSSVSTAATRSSGSG